MPFKDKETRNKHRLENKDRYNKQARENYDKRKDIRAEQSRNHYHIKEKFNRMKLRNDLFKLLGGKICVNCGFIDERALQFDHINGDGSILEIKTGRERNKTFYKKYLDDPELAKKTLQVLCANCNWIKRVVNQEFKKRK